jgi:hypothetical protein
MHRAARGTNRSGRLGWRMLFGGFAVLLVSVAIRTLRLPLAGTVRRDLASTLGEPVRRTPEGELILPAAAHEPADIGRGFIGGAFGLLLVSLAVVTLGVLWLFPLPGTDRTLHTPLPVYPEPRLQPNPRQEMQRFLAAEQAELKTYGWIDKAHGIVRIPIDVAMDKVARSGIPGWPDSAAAAEASPTTTAATTQ